MPRKLQSILPLALLFLYVVNIYSYEPIITIGKPGLQDILYSSDGQYLVTLTSMYAEFLDAESLEPVKQFPAKHGDDIALSPDNSLLSVANNQHIQIWHVPSEELLTTITIEKERTSRNGKFSPDGKYLAYADQDTVYLWHTEEQKIVRELIGDPEYYVRDIAFHPNGKILAVALRWKIIYLWDVENGEILSSLEMQGHDVYADALVFNNDGSLLAAWGSNDDTLRVWNLDTGDLKLHYVRHIRSFAFTLDDRYLLVGDGQGNLHALQSDTLKGEKIPAVTDLPPPNYGNMVRLERIAIHPDGKRLATLINGTRVRFWNIQDFSWTKTLYGYSYMTAEALYLPEINRIVTGLWSDVLCFWDSTTGELLYAKEFFETIPALEAAPDGRKIAFARYHTKNEIWDAENIWQLLAMDRCDPLMEKGDAPFFGGPTKVIAFSPSGKYLASNGWRGTFIWDTKTGELVNWVLNGWSDARFMQFTPNEEQIFMIVPEKREMEFWNIETGELVDKTGNIGQMMRVGRNFIQARHRDDTVEVYMFGSGKRLCSISGVPEINEEDTWWLFDQYQFHPSGNILAVRYDMDDDEGLTEYRFYNIWTGGLLSTISGIKELQFTKDDDYVFIMDENMQLGLYYTSDVLGKSVSSVFTSHAFDTIATFGQIKGDQLFQNYPNPFNPETWIPYTLSKHSHVAINIYTATGQLARTLDLGSKIAGTYFSKDRAAYWDGKNQQGDSVVSGTYFCQIITDGFSGIKKMLLVK